MQPSINLFLNAVMRSLRARRPTHSLTHILRIEHTNSAPFAMMWFASHGCSFDARGECSVCNYGHGSDLNWDAVLSGMRWELEASNLTEDTPFVLSPSGNMLDDNEVPPEARTALYELASRTPCRVFGFETRVETIARDKLVEFRSYMGKRSLFIEMGLESADPLILKYCLGKSTDLDSYAQKIEMMLEYGIAPICNVLLGTPFLTSAEAVGDALRTVQWALDIGFSKAVIFPVHIKRFTVVEKLLEADLYVPISLWALVEVLCGLPADMLTRTSIAWYGDLAEEAKEDIIESPETCNKCRPRVVGLLDRFSATGDIEAISELGGICCTCRNEWEFAMHFPAESSLSERLKRAYLVLARSSHGMTPDALERIMIELERDFALERNPAPSRRKVWS